MSSWKLNWLRLNILSRETFKKNLKTLKNPWVFYIALLVTLIPGFLKKGIRFHLKHGGSFLIKDFIGCYIYWEIFLYNSYHLFPDEKTDPVIIDIGAHIGLAAIRFKQVYPDAEIHCYEPFPENYTQLTTNIQKCGLQRIHIHQKGVANTNRRATLYIHGSNSGAHSIFPVDRLSKTDEITLINLSEVLCNTSTGRCDLIKLDCEGAEYEIIKSIDHDLASKIQGVMYEVHHDKYNPQELVSHLETLGYQVTDLDGTVFKAIYNG